MAMIDRHRIAALRVGMAFGMLAVGAAVAFPAAAVAVPAPEPLPVPLPGDPPPPPGPNIPGVGAPLGPAGANVLAQTEAPGAPGLPPLTGLTRDDVLGLNAVPSAPGAGPGTPPNLNIFNNAYGLALNEAPAAPGQGQQFDVAPGQENADVSKREWFGRYIDLYRAGDLKGGLLGRVPQEQLGQPFPGTAPPPGTVIPAGPVQFLPDPADGPTAPPGLVLPPPPPPPA